MDTNLITTYEVRYTANSSNVRVFANLQTNVVMSFNHERNAQAYCQQLNTCGYEGVQFEVVAVTAPLGSAMKFPERFKLEGVNPLEAPVVIVTDDKILHYKNIAQVPASEIKGLIGPMADKVNGQWAVRFESQSIYDRYYN